MVMVQDSISSKYMRIDEFIKWLKDGKIPEDTCIELYDPDAELWLTPTGYVYDPEKKTVRIYTDEQ
jgi:hypothetical protein